MNFKHTVTVLLILGGFFAPRALVAQKIAATPLGEPQEVSDAFLESFYEALKQKSIENYALAITALEKAQKESGGNLQADAIVFFEFAKNQIKLKQYNQAEINLEKVLRQEPENQDVLETLYDLYYLTREYNKAIVLVKKLIVYDQDYKEDLANLYQRTKQYEKALLLLDELEASWGESVYRTALRKQIYRQTGNTRGAINNAEKKRKNNPANEREYLNLIYLYSENGNPEKAYQTALELQNKFPNSILVHLALYKFHLDQGNTMGAMASMKKVFNSRVIEKESQYKVLGDFLTFVQQNPQYQAELEGIVEVFSKDNNGQVFEKIADYYLSKGNKELALTFYQKGIEVDSDNFSLLKNTLLLQLEFNRFAAAKNLSASSLEVFPAQPVLYLLNAKANNNLQDFKAAINALETGLDYFFDNTELEKEFYEQLAVAYTGLGNTIKAANFAKKAAEILDSN
ncbi:hypothetical protein N9459_03470 [Flavobacteriaceae bacterium]|nr:hypothetical protein [Flavobacteriaceae bacterium]